MDQSQTGNDIYPLGKSYRCLLSGQAEILARFKPELDVSTLIPSIRNAQRAMRTCLGRFSNTRHMVLYYEDVIRDRNVGITTQTNKQTFPAASDGFRVPNKVTQ